MKAFLLVFFLLYLYFPYLSAEVQNIKKYNLFGKTMGNKYQVTWVSERTAPENVLMIRSEIEARLEEVNNAMSTWQENSEISKFNQLVTHDELKISGPFKFVLSKALQLGELTGGALDVTVAPLVELWGFGASTKAREVPSSEQITEVLAYTGMDKIKLKGDKLSKQDPRTQLDLSAIAKGYGVDEVAQVLMEEGIENFLVDIGGELAVKGQRIDGSPWQVLIEMPFANEKSKQVKISLSDHAVATSGDYRNFFIQGDTRFSHIIDPKYGRSVQRQVISATVIAKDCATADGLATAAVVMGIKLALELADEQGIAMMLIENNFGGLKVHHSKEFKKFLL